MFDYYILRLLIYNVIIHTMLSSYVNNVIWNFENVNKKSATSKDNI